MYCINSLLYSLTRYRTPSRSLSPSVVLAGCWNTGAGGQGLEGVSCCIHVPIENSTGVNSPKSNCQSNPNSPPAFVKCYKVARGFTRVRVQVESARDGGLCAESLSHRRGWKLQRYRAKTGRQITMQEEIQILLTLLEKKRVHDGNFNLWTPN